MISAFRHALDDGRPQSSRVRELKEKKKKKKNFFHAAAPAAAYPWKKKIKDEAERGGDDGGYMLGSIFMNEREEPTDPWVSRRHALKQKE